MIWRVEWESSRADTPQEWRNPVDTLPTFSM
jgi:hypothetical protein